MGVSAPDSAIFYYPIENSATMKMGLTAKFVSGTNVSKKCVNPKIFPLNNGGYVVLYEEFNNNEIYVHVIIY